MAYLINHPATASGTAITTDGTTATTIASFDISTITSIAATTILWSGVIWVATGEF